MSDLYNNQITDINIHSAGAPRIISKSELPSNNQKKRESDYNSNVPNDTNKPNKNILSIKDILKSRLIANSNNVK